MHKVLHPWNDVDRLYVSRRQRGRGLACIEETIDTSIQRLEDYIEKREEKWLQPPETTIMTQGPVEW